MELPSFIENKVQEWRDMDPKFRKLLIAVAVIGSGFIAYKSAMRQPPQPSTAAALPATPATASAAPSATAAQGAPAGFTQSVNVLPSSPRNQGLEDLSTEIKALNKRLDDMQRGSANGGVAGSNITLINRGDGAGASAPAASSGPTASAAGTTSKDLPDAVSFDQSGTRASNAAVGGQSNADQAPANVAPPPPSKPARPVLQADSVGKDATDDEPARPDLVLPMYTGLEAVMLSGVNARPSGAAGGAAGTAMSAVNVGAPFVSRVKGLAIMPNSWKAADLANCFVGGSATAVLSAERAYAIADHISCISKEGEVYEAPINAYALDVDGTLGLAGKVVNKQGAMLMQAALTGMAAGLGSALAPSAVPSYNTNVGSGQQQGWTVPSPGFLAGTAVGQGINHAATQLSQFYLNFAKETFPVVEVTAGTRVTWILKQAIVLKKRNFKKDVDQ